MLRKTVNNLSRAVPTFLLAILVSSSHNNITKKSYTNGKLTFMKVYYNKEDRTLFLLFAEKKLSCVARRSNTKITEKKLNLAFY